MQQVVVTLCLCAKTHEPLLLRITRMIEAMQLRLGPVVAVDNHSLATGTGSYEKQRAAMKLLWDLMEGHERHRRATPESSRRHATLMQGWLRNGPRRNPLAPTDEGVVQARLCGSATHSPPFMTSSMFSSRRMSSTGSPRTPTMSANVPGAREPTRSSQPMSSEAHLVAL